MSIDIKMQQNLNFVKSSVKVVFFSVKIHSGAFEKDKHHFLILINYFKPFKNIYQHALGSANTYLKHKTVDNCSSVILFFFLMKEAHNGKYTDLIVHRTLLCDQKVKCNQLIF